MGARKEPTHRGAFGTEPTARRGADVFGAHPHHGLGEGADQVPVPVQGHESEIGGQCLHVAHLGDAYRQHPIFDTLEFAIRNQAVAQDRDLLPEQSLQTVRIGTGSGRQPDMELAGTRTHIVAAPRLGG